MEAPILDVLLRPRNRARPWKFVAIPAALLLLLVNTGYSARKDSGSVIYARAKEEILRLNFTRAYLGLSEASRGCAEPSSCPRPILLKNILSLALTFSNLRLAAAYRMGQKPYGPSGEEGKEEALSPFQQLEIYRRQYAERARLWRNRLEEDIDSSSKIGEAVYISLMYPGLKQLHSFVRTGIDSIENVKKGIPPTPSQAENIEQKEHYAGVLSALYLSMGKDFRLSEDPFRLEGMVKPDAVISYSRRLLETAAEFFRKDSAFDSGIQQGPTTGEGHI